jgi:hypothetical protein
LSFVIGADGFLPRAFYQAMAVENLPINYDLRPDWDDPSYPVPFPAGDWRILVSEYSSNTSGIGSPAAYGLGNPPAAYTRTDHWMTTTLTP